MEYNTALCDFLRLPADPCIQSYVDVTTQIYPLRADYRKVQRFCDKYLNLNKSPYETFEPAGPWIIMQVVDYGRMGFANQDDGRFAHRWFGQHELAFGIPVRCVDTQTQTYREFAVVYPFIFVDNPLSIEGGRQIYGWPKAGIEIEATPPELEPHLPHTLVRVKVSPFLLTRDGQKSSDTPLVEVQQTRTFLSGRAGIAQAITSVPRAVGGYFSIVSSVFDSMSKLANLVSGYKYPTAGSLADNLAVLGRDVQSLGDTLQKGFGYFNSMIPMLIGITTGRQDLSTPATRPTLPIYTMKQIRDAEDTKSACYQAIVRSEMTIDDVKDAGLLFDPLSGDPSGGVEIKLRSKGNAYMDDLIDMVSSGPDASGTHCVSPLVPFWEKVDLSYGLAERQSWRTKHTEWRQDSDAASSAKDAKEKKQYIAYDKRGSGSLLAVPGDRKVDNATLHVFMLHADQGKLQNLVDLYLNKLSGPNVKDKPPFEFKVKNPPYVCVMLLSYNDMTIGGQGSYGDTVLSFTLLTKYYQVDQYGKRGGPDPAFVPLYNFVGTDWNFVTEHEVYGRLVFKSSLVSPEDAWVKQSAPSNVPHEVLSVSTTLFPRHAEGESAVVSGSTETRTQERVVAISSMPLPELQSVDFGSSDPTAAHEFLASYGLAEYLTHAGAIPDTKSIALKQVRNAMHSEGADYQSLVAIQRSFALKGKGVKSRVMIRIYKLEGFPLLANLGLEGRAGSDQNGDYEEFDADALSFSGDLLERQGQELWWRVAPQDMWTRGS